MERHHKGGGKRRVGRRGSVGCVAELTVLEREDLLQAEAAEQLFGGNNYFKLRDVAMLLNGTLAQFSVGYDAASGTITVQTGAPYEPAGGELATGTDRSDTCKASTQLLTIDGSAPAVTAYNIGGNNFFKLRELGEALNFSVDYDEATRTMVVASN